MENGQTNGQTPEQPLQVGELVVFGDGKTGTITRAYPIEDKFAVKTLGSSTEIRGPDNSFFYFKQEELQRAAPLPEAEPAHKKAKHEVAEPEQTKRELAPGRFEGRVKWFSKEKGFGKIQPTAGNGQTPVEDVFLHIKQMDGGVEGPHASAVMEGVLVTYEVTTHYDGKPCGCNIQVDEVAQAIAAVGHKEFQGQKADLIRKLLLSGMQIGNFQVRGVGKPSMEDRFISRPGVPVDGLGSCKEAVCSLFGVFDGHSGASCSDFVATNLDRSLFDCLRHQSKRDVNADMAMRAALLASFRMTEHNYFQYLNKLEGGAAHAWATAGSTACSACLFGPDEEGRLRLAVANAGDSRVVLGKRDGTAVRLSEDHTPDVPGERRRIEQEGSAVVNAQGIWRIVLPSRKGTGLAGLSVSRGFGDLEYKQPAGVVSAVPDVTLRVLDLREDAFVVFGSDGIWGPVSDSDAVRIVSLGLREGGDDPATLAAQQLVEEAHRRDGHDDKTALVVWFGDLPSVSEMPVRAPDRTAVMRMQPRQVAIAAASGGGGDDMFSVRRPAANSKADPPQETADLDDLFTAYARDMGVR